MYLLRLKYWLLIFLIILKVTDGHSNFKLKQIIVSNTLRYICWKKLPTFYYTTWRDQISSFLLFMTFFSLIGLIYCHDTIVPLINLSTRGPLGIEKLSKTLTTFSLFLQSSWELIQSKFIGGLKKCFISFKILGVFKVHCLTFLKKLDIFYIKWSQRYAYDKNSKIRFRFLSLLLRR